MDELSPTTDACYKPQFPLEYRDCRTPAERRREKRYEEHRYESRRPKSEDRAGDRYYDERRYDDFRYPTSDRWGEEQRRFGNERRQRQSGTYRNEGRNYRDELLERFADIDFEDHHDTQDHQDYFE